jgi:hypothetical protein
LPPSVASVCTRERLWLPPLHDTVHVLQAENAPLTQSVGHACSLHVFASLSCGQAEPPQFGCVCGRVRTDEPVPHDLLQGSQLPQLPIVQSTAHSWLLQSLSTRVDPQALPPDVGGVFVRERVCVPVPQEAVHEVHADHMSSVQSVAHGCVLQSRVSARYGHA